MLARLFNTDGFTKNNNLFIRIIRIYLFRYLCLPRTKLYVTNKINKLLKTI